MLKDEIKVGSLGPQVKSVRCCLGIGGGIVYVAEDQNFIYYVESNSALVRYRWKDIIDGFYGTFVEIATNVADFLLTDGRVIVLTLDKKIQMGNGTEVNLGEETEAIEWKKIAIVQKGRVVCGGQIEAKSAGAKEHMTGVIAVIGKKGDLRGRASMPMYNNGLTKSRKG